MAVIVVGGVEPEAGATTMAAGLAHRLAYAGNTVRVERLAGDARAEGDAALFATLEFASASGTPLAVPSDAAADGGVTVLEAPAGADPAAIARQAGGGRVLLVSAAGDAASAGSTGGATTIANRVAAGAAMAVPEDRLLAAPTVEVLREVSGARVLARSVVGDASICEHIVVGPVFEDSDEPHFGRFDRKVIVTRAEKVDIALAALRTAPRCLILTGGHDPSPYLLDRVASDRNTTLLLSPNDTVTTVHAIEGTFGSAAFSGAEKVERIGQHLAAAIDDVALA
ncbi:MAG: DRTGG domain-containing protein, partial [Dehalococcoidia bacterium]|nr:DRTGG domain-containing protein [Dehalococcoidia bacterium]